MFSHKYVWYNLSSDTYSSQSYTCGYCGHAVASEKGYQALVEHQMGNPHTRIYICHFCTRPTFFDEETGKQWPGTAFGGQVSDITDELVEKMYDEARHSTSTGSYTAAVMCCRKLLMHVAVSLGASANQRFVYYVDYLASNNYIPPGAKAWVSEIKNKGNEANHEIKLMTQADAEELISFSEMLLKVIYEFPARIKPSSNTKKTGGTAA